MKATINPQTGQIQTRNGVPILTWETKEEFEKLRKGPNKYGHLMKRFSPQQSRIPNNNRKVTKARSYRFIPVVKMIGKGHAMKVRKLVTNSFKKIFDLTNK